VNKEQGHPGVTQSRNEMAGSVDQKNEQQISPLKERIDEVNRIMEIGKMLFAVLTHEEQKQLQELLESSSTSQVFVDPTKNR
jgi:hypothetical protein